MTQHRGIRTNIDEMLQRIPADRAEMFLGFSPSSQDCEGWIKSFREHFPDWAVGIQIRTIWDSLDNRDARVLIDVYECSSAQNAVHALYRVLESDQLAEMPEGPSDVGYLAFTHPERAPPAVFFVRGNLCVVITSFGRTRVAVVPWAQRIDRRLLERPIGTVPLESLSISGERVFPGEIVEIQCALPARLVDDGYVKLFADGGTLEHLDGKLFARATRVGELALELFLVEPGRPIYVARERIKVSSGPNE